MEERRQPYNPFNNPDFREEMGKLLDEKLQPIREETADLKASVASHDRSIQRTKGAMAVLSFVWAGLLAIAEYLRH